ncbi:uncharacterized protein LOC142229305 [Haematobia irritans]|uniref:uncharacterized protein LOC142229305 n=1 Tax=Haematobia irritans TaxID=7368 RepID=UPI003F4F9BD4
MATKTIITCMDPNAGVSNGSSSPTTQTISIKIDPFKSETNKSSDSNVIKIQHSYDEETSSPSATLSSSPPAALSNLNTSNKLLIDINHEEESAKPVGDLLMKETQYPAIVKVNCITSNVYSRDQTNAFNAKENSPKVATSIKLETVNGSISRAESKILEDGNEYEDDHVEADQEKEKSFNHSQDLNESGQTAKIPQRQMITTTITTSSSSSSSLLSESAKTSQQVNGNSKWRENNGQFPTNQTKHLANDHNDDHDDHDNDDDNDPHQHNDDNNNDVFKSLGMGKRDSCLDISHDGSKRWPNQENSNSLLTKADTTTSSSNSTSSNIHSLIINEENGNKKENCNENSKRQQKEEDEISKPISNSSSKTAHVVKIQINPNTAINPNGLEKQISIVKIESTKFEEESEKHKENRELNEAINTAQKESENFSERDNQILDKSTELVRKQSELHLNLEKMVQQRPSQSQVQKHQHQQQNSTSSNGINNQSSSSSTSTSSSSSSSATMAHTNGSSVTDLNVSNTNYLYYSAMSSGQFSPCDTLDSGTGSDLENHNHNSSSPKAHLLLPKKSSNNPSAKSLEMHLKTTKIRVSSSNSGNKNDTRNCSSYTDSEESEASSLSCDSLHSNEFMRQSSTSPLHNKTPSPSSKILGSYLPDSLLREIKNLKLNHQEYEAENELEEEDEEEEEEEEENQIHRNGETKRSSEYSINDNDYVQRRNTDNFHSNSSTTNTSIKRASMPSKTFVLNQEDGTFIDMKMNSMPRKYEADKYYNFHVNEHENFRSFGNNATSPFSDGSDSLSISDYEGRTIHDDVFAGYKDIRCGSATSTIRSNKGTVRGVKNRVRNGIATFLQLQQPNMKNFKEKDSGKVVLYTTSMGIIRDTYAKCSNVKQILRTLLVKFEERDVFMSVEYQQEIKERMHSEIIQVPQLFVEGQHIGDAETVERLNESGELRQLLKAYKSIATTYTCQTCGGYRLLPCPSCKGSKKSVHRNHFTAEFVALKCMNCDEVGLVKCHNC